MGAAVRIFLLPLPYKKQAEKQILARSETGETTIQETYSQPLTPPLSTYSPVVCGQYLL